MKSKSILVVVFMSLLFTSLQAKEVIELNKDWVFINPYRSWTEGYRLTESKNTVNLPHDWSIEGPFDKKNPAGSSGGYLPGGKALYRKEVMIPTSWKNQKIYIEFDGVYQNSEVFINGVLVGKRPNGWISFYYDITPWITVGQNNLIAVRVTNDDMPNCRWYSGTGMYRKARIYSTSPIHTKHWGVFVTTPVVEKEYSILSVSSSIVNETNSAQYITIQHKVLDENGKEVAQKQDVYPLSPNIERTFSIQFPISKPQLWDIDSPHIYQLKTTILKNDTVCDVVTNNFGIKKERFDKDKGFFLNDRNVKLKGVCLHHDGGMVGAAVPEMVWERRLRILKDMGCNAIRTSHNPYDPVFYDLCDRMGFLVMNEAFDEWTVYTVDQVPNGYNKYWDEWHEKDLTDFVMRDRNHPSVFMWSVGNEIIEQSFPIGKDISRKLVEIVKRLDPTRPVTCGNNKHVEANITGFADEYDVVGYNYGPQFGMFEPDRKKYPNRLMVGTESTRGTSTRGCYVFPVSKNYAVQRSKDNYFSSYDGRTRKYGQEYEWHITDSLDYVTGMFIWTGFDYIGETSFPWPTKYCDFGPIDACGFPKDAYYFYRSVWNEKETTLHLLPHWNWQGREGEITPVWCYTNCDEVELFLNGQSKGRKKIDIPTLYHIEWNDVKYEKGELKAVGYKKGKKIIEKVLQTTSEPVEYTIKADKTQIKANSQDVVHFEISVKDKNGLFIPNANTDFNVEVTGGKLLGIDSGDPQYVGSFKALKDRKLFNGLALIIVQSKNKKEDITVKISGSPEIKAAQSKVAVI
jgi:beta-galactosidase